MIRTIAELQEFLGGLKVDGIAGPATRAAVAAVLDPVSVVVLTPTGEAQQQWPREADAGEFYGHPNGTEGWEETHLTTIIPPYTMWMDGMVINRIRCHRKVAESLSRILLKVWELYPTPEGRAKVGVDQYDGCYSYRAVRGSSRLSMHAYGAAIDLDAAHNQLGAVKGRMPLDVVSIFKQEGWRWGGDYTGRKDLMHFEACR